MFSSLFPFLITTPIAIFLILAVIEGWYQFIVFAFMLSCMSIFTAFEFVIFFISSILFTVVIKLGQNVTAEFLCTKQRLNGTCNLCLKICNRNKKSSIKYTPYMYSECEIDLFAKKGNLSVKKLGIFVLAFTDKI